jgi:hypothetical protein
VQDVAGFLSLGERRVYDHRVVTNPRRRSFEEVRADHLDPQLILGLCRPLRVYLVAEQPWCHLQDLSSDAPVAGGRLQHQIACADSPGHHSLGQLRRRLEEVPGELGLELPGEQQRLDLVRRVVVEQVPLHLLVPTAT